MVNMGIYYTYIYLNPLKPGRYSYGDYVTFMYEPFYVGKGSKDQIYSHLRENKSRTCNNHKFSTIQKIRRNETTPIVFKVADSLNENCSFCFEKYLISLIGRNDLHQGPLSNHTDGGEGGKGIVLSEEAKRKISVANKGKKMSKEFCKNQSDRLKSKNPAFGRIWVYKNSANKLIKSKNLDDYLKAGWVKGLRKETTDKTKHLGIKNGAYGKVWIYNKDLDKMIYIKKDELESYISQGWIKGMKPGIMKKSEDYKNKLSESRKGNNNPVRKAKTRIELQIYMCAL